jgi:hypothetical protein
VVIAPDSVVMRAVVREWVADRRDAATMAGVRVATAARPRSCQNSTPIEKTSLATLAV